MQQTQLIVNLNIKNSLQVENGKLVVQTDLCDGKFVFSTDLLEMLSQIDWQDKESFMFAMNNLSHIIEKERDQEKYEEAVLQKQEMDRLVEELLPENEIDETEHLYQAEVVDPEDGSDDLMILFPDELTNKLNLKEGDSVSLDISSGKIMLRKITPSTPQSYEYDTEEDDDENFSCCGGCSHEQHPHINKNKLTVSSFRKD